MSRRKIVGEEEKAQMWADLVHKGQLTNHRERSMPLHKLRVKIQKDLQMYASKHYSATWLEDIYGVKLWQDATTGAYTVSHSYKVTFSSWPLGGSAYDDNRHRRTQSITHTVTVPLRDYWRLGLQGKGV